MKNALATMTLGPLLYLQGKYVRRTVPRLPEARGERKGTVGAGEEIRILFAGDSAAAGVGAETLDEALVGQVLNRLSTNFTISWRQKARTGATTDETIQRLKKLPPEPFDVLIPSLGVNDVTAGTPVGQWLDAQRELRSIARDRFGVQHFVISQLPPIHRFPALPQPLRWYLGRQAREYSAAMEAECGTESDMTFVAPEFTDDPAHMASDGFHPGPTIYSEWADAVAAAVKNWRSVE